MKRKHRKLPGKVDACRKKTCSGRSCNVANRERTFRQRVGGGCREAGALEQRSAKPNSAMAKARWSLRPWRMAPGGPWDAWDWPGQGCVLCDVRHGPLLFEEA